MGTLHDPARGVRYRGVDAAHEARVAFAHAAASGVMILTISEQSARCRTSLELSDAGGWICRGRRGESTGTALLPIDGFVWSLPLDKFNLLRAAVDIEPQRRCGRAGDAAASCCRLRKRWLFFGMSGRRSCVLALVHFWRSAIVYK